jgi:DNA primase
VVPGGFDDTFIAEVRARNDIVSVVSDYVTLRKAGHSHKGLCPFHGEKTPSFTVHAGKQFFYCFGCQASGDVISFVKEINGFSFPEAVRHLAGRAGIAVPEMTTGTWRGRGESREVRKEARDNFLHVNRLATRFYVETLNGEYGLVCREYLKKRGVDPQWSARFELGCAPDRWDGLVQYLGREGADLQAAEILGLIVRKQDGRGHYDRFRNRLMFPIHSLSGDVIGFSGRDLGGSTLVPAANRQGEPAQAPAKYVNSPESPVYTKGDELYGLAEARPALRRQHAAVLVEGNLDLVRLHQFGIGHAVAPLGTALTGTQLRTLKRFVPRVIALYDGDQAGREAARKAVHLCLAEGVVIDVVALPAGSDPDSFLGTEGPDALNLLISNAVPGWEYLIDLSLRETRGTQSIQGARLTLDQLAPVLADVEDRDARALYEGRLAGILGLDAAIVRDRVRAVAGRRVPDQPPRTQAHAAQASRPASAPLPPPERELKVLELLLTAPEVRPVFIGHDGLEHLTHPDVRHLTARVLDEGGDPTTLLASLPGGELRNQLFQRMAQGTPTAGSQAMTELGALMRGLRIEAIGRRVEALRREERRACLTNDETKAMTLMRERLELQRQLDDLRSMRG